MSKERLVGKDLKIHPSDMIIHRARGIEQYRAELIDGYQKHTKDLRISPDGKNWWSLNLTREEAKIVARTLIEGFDLKKQQ